MRQLPKLPRKAWWGICFMYLAGLGWIACVIVPFMNVEHKVAIVAGILVAAEISFLVGVALLGKAYYKELKERLTQMIKGKTDKS